MLKNTFCHIPGVGVRTESRLWSLGLHSWDNILNKGFPVLSPPARSSLSAFVRESIKELNNGNSIFFAERLPTAEHWRLFADFRDSVAYVDIETTGLRPSLSTITTIALYDGHDVRYYVYDRNLDDFIDELSRYKLIVTYNGKCFDIPFIESFFDVEVDAAHIDLRYVLRSLGYKGGLKGCEKQMGIDRGDLDGVDGYFAVLLWNEFLEEDNEKALETLLAYNIEDVVNLERLMVMAYNMKLKRTPFLASHQFDPPKSPPLPFSPDPDTIRTIREKYYLR
ncbi:MAG: ribonuclease H-like domain-containing protein [Candidatus Latescibacterota bacterium]|nr:MAG: ribonuclease H-like domain-containing protein [Candidatus Latescibacterota bacterium]